MKKLSILILLLAYSVSALSIDNGVLRYDWKYSTVNYFLNVKKDSATTPYALNLETVAERKGAFCCLVPLPKINVSKVELKVRYKTEDRENLYLKLASIGECEKIIAIDTLHLAKSDTWTVLDDSVSLDSPKLLSISLEATGSKEKNGKIWFNTMDLYVNGKNINSGVVAMYAYMRALNKMKDKP